MEVESILQKTMKVLGVAVLMGGLSDLLLRDGPWGLNAALWSGVFAMLLWLLSRNPDTATAARCRWCVPLIVLFGAMLMWRDAPVLKLLDIAVILILCATLILRPGVESILRTGFGHYLAAFFDGGIGAATGLPSMVAVDIPKQLREAKSSTDPAGQSVLVRHLWSASAGIAIAIPLLLLFGGLFVSADSAFRSLVRDLFNLNWEILCEHLLVIGVATWVVAGYLNVLIMKRRAAWSPEAAYEGVRLDALTILIPLGTLVALFATFVVVQIPYFFGGDATVQSQTGLSYARYAREGFLQLVTVAALAFAVLLLADWLGRNASPHGRRTLRGFTVTLVALVFVVMASAFHRMALYTSAYGLTTLRFYTTAFMIWLAAVLLWFLLVMVRGRRERFLFPAIASASACVFVFHAINPERIIVQVNTSHAEKVNEFDIEYLLTLSNDATPALMAFSDRLPEYERSLLRGPLERRINRAKEGGGVEYSQRLDRGGWRAWSWSRYEASNALQQFVQP